MGYDNHADHLLPDDAVFIKQFELAAAQLKLVLDSKILGAGPRTIGLTWAAKILDSVILLVRDLYKITEPITTVESKP